ncbi:hypothetical protein ACLOAV_003985 [Pseudogymnoascus australis]
MSRRKAYELISPGKAASWADRRAAGPGADKAIGREKDHAWKDQHRGKTNKRGSKSQSTGIAIDDLRTVYIHRHPIVEHECLHGPRLENMTALGDDMVLSK